MYSTHTTSSLLQPDITAPGRASAASWGAAPAPGQDAGALLHSDISMPGVFSMGFLTLRVLLSNPRLSASTNTGSSGLSSPANMMR